MNTANDILLCVDPVNLTHYQRRAKFERRFAGHRELRRRVHLLDEFTCQRCGIQPDEWPAEYDGSLYVALPDGYLVLDHIVPRSRGGLTQIDNLQTLCARCNSSKGAL